MSPRSPAARRRTATGTACRTKDGELDLTVGGDNTWILLLENNGDLTFTTVPVNGMSANFSLAAGDLDGDSFSDLAFDRYFSLHPEGGTFTPPQTWLLEIALRGEKTPAGLARSIPAGKSPRAVLAADLDQDGRIDLAAANQGSDNASVILNGGDGKFPVPINYSAGDRPSAGRPTGSPADRSS